MSLQPHATNLGFHGCYHLVRRTLQDPNTPLEADSSYPYVRLLYFAIAHIDGDATTTTTTTTEHFFGAYKRWAETAPLSPYATEAHITYPVFQEHMDLILTGLGYQRVARSPSSPEPAAFVGLPVFDTPQPPLIMRHHVNNLIAFYDSIFPPLSSFGAPTAQAGSALQAPGSPIDPECANLEFRPDLKPLRSQSLFAYGPGTARGMPPTRGYGPVPPNTSRETLPGPRAEHQPTPSDDESRER